MKLLYPFDETPLPTASEVGRKGLSLMTLFQSGLPVPKGFVLTVSFFEPWMVLLKATPAWEAFRAADTPDLRDACRQLKQISSGYALTPEQKTPLHKALLMFEAHRLWAVRSSSPEEDGAGASFAGCYETALGVSSDKLDEAIHSTFASCLDARAFAYKREHGFDVFEPRIAVVVQEQIAGDVAGVGFSAHPHTGDSSQAVFESNWGLGETVVSGRVTPDYFVVHKPTRAILERRVGRKERASVLLPGGGTSEQEDPRHDQLSLQDGQLQALTDALLAIESRYGWPMDMEWAFAEGRLFVLQARPITTSRPGAPSSRAS